MALTVAVDPGLRVCGVATFGYDGLTEGLASAAEVKTLTPKVEAGPQAWGGMADAIIEHLGTASVSALVIEVPQIYRAQLLKGDPNDLLHLVGVLGHLTAQLEGFHGLQGFSTVHYLPAQWKGQVPKNIHHERVFKRLSASEKKAWPKGHNARDAVGLGLFHLGRMERTRK